MPNIGKTQAVIHQILSRNEAIQGKSRGKGLNAVKDPLRGQPILPGGFGRPKTDDMARASEGPRPPFHHALASFFRLG